MEPLRSKLHTVMHVLAMAALLVNAQLIQAKIMDETIQVEIKLQDEAGRSISFVSVWAFIEKTAEHERGSAWPTAHLKEGDLWRITQRYGALHDIVSSYGDKPVPYLRIPPMGNSAGVFNDIIDYQEATGKGNRYPRPDPLTFGYTFMKHGYFPGKANFTVPKNQGRVEAIVTLKRNPKEALETQPYLQKFAEVRYQLSDTAKNTAMTPENDRRMRELKYELEQAAQQAIAAGDKPAAARIYARMRYMPSLIYLEGKIAGFSQGDAASAEAERAMEMAYQLDPDNLYVWMQTVNRRGNRPTGTTQEQNIRANIQELEKLIAKHGEAAWPEIYRWHAGSHAAIGDYAKARQLYLDASQIEPKFTDWSATIDNMKAQMRRKGVSIPANW